MNEDLRAITWLFGFAVGVWMIVVGFSALLGWVILS